jgi:hypothetical protein
MPVVVRNVVDMRSSDVLITIPVLTPCGCKIEEKKQNP